MPPPFLKKSKKNKGVYPVYLHKDDPDKTLAYINLTILDASDAVYGMVHSKIRERQQKMPGPDFIKQKVAQKVAKAASANVPPKAIAEQLSKKLPKKLMYMMYHKTGMRLAAQTVFVEDVYVVIQLQVQYVDSMRLLDKAKEEKKDDGEESDDESVATQVLEEWLEEQNQLKLEENNSAFVTTSKTEQKEKSLPDCFKGATTVKAVIINILTWILLKLGGTDVHRALEERHLPALVQSKITENMQEMMAKKLQSKSLKADIAVLDEAEESRYFFKHLQQVRSRETTNATSAQQ